MFNTRDSFTDLNPKKGNYIEVPYVLRSVLQNKNDNSLIRVIHYRITVENYKSVIYVGINHDLSSADNTIEEEIKLEEIISNYKNVSDFFTSPLDLENEKRLLLNLR